LNRNGGTDKGQYRSGGARKVPLEVLHLILRYYSRLAISTDSYVQVFFCFARIT
jgi:hypothetical protein